MADDTLTAEEVRKILKISRSTMDLWIKAGRLKGYKVGRRWLFKRRDIEALIDAHAAEPRRVLRGTLGQLLAFAGAWRLSEREAKTLIKEIYTARGVTERKVAW